MGKTIIGANFVSGVMECWSIEVLEKDCSPAVLVLSLNHYPITPFLHYSSTPLALKHEFLILVPPDADSNRSVISDTADRICAHNG